MDIRKTFATNKSKELEGVWIDIGDGASIKVARQGNPEAQTLLQDMLKPHRTALRLNRQIPTDVWKDIGIKVTARAILRDWKGFTEGGAPLPYTRDTAERILTEHDDFRELVAGYAADVKLFQDEEEAAVQKN